MDVKLPFRESGSIRKGDEDFWCKMRLFSLEEMVKANDTRGTGSSLEKQQELMLAERFIRQALQLLVECVRESALVEGRHFYSGHTCKKIRK